MNPRTILTIVLACAAAAGMTLLADSWSTAHGTAGAASLQVDPPAIGGDDLYAINGGEHGDQGDEGFDEDEDEGDDDRVICVCHVPKGNPDQAHTICVGASAVCAHLEHGDELGPCRGTCGGADGATCDEGQFCRRPEGECAVDAEGVCVDLPATCISVFAPVCGCDGRTYSNACYAGAAGVTVEHEGACAEQVACGGAAGDSCVEGQYCRRPVGECADDAQGICAEIPAACPAVFVPVCGCDGVTHDNECFAAAAGTTVAAAGPCEEQQACGGQAGDTCAEDQFCRRETGECSADAEGVCAVRPPICQGVLAPVCGCDGVTYDNPCLADAAGVTVASTDACVPEQACGGTAGDTCGEGQFCQRPTGACGEETEGVCVQTPTACPVTFAPVCGCDQITYSNACLAAAAGVTVASDGGCVTPQRLLQHRRRR